MANEPAALNKRLLSQMAQQTTDTDLPLGPGDTIEISVLDVEELSKFRARIPLRGTITLPLIGPLLAGLLVAIFIIFTTFGSVTFGEVFVTLFVIMDPLGSIPLFLGLTGGACTVIGDAQGYTPPGAAMSTGEAP